MYGDHSNPGCLLSTQSDPDSRGSRACSDARSGGNERGESAWSIDVGRGNEANPLSRRFLRNFGQATVRRRERGYNYECVGISNSNDLQEATMIRHVAYLAMAVLAGIPLQAGELDNE